MTVDRNNPASPPTLVVHRGTTVTIQVINARGNEIVTFTPTTTKVAPPDIIGTAVKSAIVPLQNLVVDQQTHIGGLLRANVPIDPILTSLNNLIANVGSVLAQMQNATVALSCLEAYKEVVDTADGRFCSATSLTADTFAIAKQTTIAELLAAAAVTLPMASYTSIHTTITGIVTATAALPDANPVKAGQLQMENEYLSADALINSIMTDAQKAQTTMAETANQLANFPDAPVVATYTITEPGNYNSSVTVVGQEFISKNNTTVATVVINWQSTQWEISTGILLSALKDQTFTNANVITNGQPVLDPTSMKNLTVVQNAFTRPTVLFPMVMANYRIRRLSNWNWENKCRNHCAFLLSGGVGLNLNQKTAEFSVGPSFQIGEVIFTPGVHIGRYTDLSQGVGVGEMLGISPPSPLPTVSRWTAKLGFAVTYVLPFQ